MSTGNWTDQWAFMRRMALGQRLAVVLVLLSMVASVILALVVAREWHKDHGVTLAIISFAASPFVQAVYLRKIVVYWTVLSKFKRFGVSFLGVGMPILLNFVAIAVALLIVVAVALFVIALFLSGGSILSGSDSGRKSGSSPGPARAFGAFWGNAELSYDSNGILSWVGDQKVQHSPDGRPSWIGSEKVQYDAKGRISWVGDRKVINGRKGPEWVGNSQVKSAE